MVVPQKRLKANSRLRISNIPDVASLDPEEVFEMSYTTASKVATGYDRLALSIIPKSIIKSFALALDPFVPFTAGKEVVTPVNRTRTRTHSYSPIRKVKKRFTAHSETRTWSISCERGPDSISDSVNAFESSKTAQPQLASITADTTSRTRPVNSRYGEFESFQFNLDVPDYSVTRHANSAVYAIGLCGSNWNHTISTAHYNYQSVGGCATIQQGALNYMRNQALTKLSGNIAKYAIELLPKTVPASRRYSLFRNVAELKDLPQSVLSLKRSLEDLSLLYRSLSSKERSIVFDLRANLSNIPKEYVSYHFGWKQLYKDIMDLLEVPSKIAKDVNRLIENNGKPQTYRSTRKPGSEVFDYPFFTFDVDVGSEQSVKQTDKLTVDYEYRLVVNAIFDFPPSIVPKVREELISRKLGLYPTPTDLYNLVPWSWLVDWFFGLGNYVAAVDAVNSDPSTFNFGFITGIARGRLESVRTSKIESTSYTRHLPQAQIDSNTTQDLNLTCVCEYVCTIRKSLASLSGVRLTSNVSSLTTYQSSILGSILLSRIKGSR